MEQLPNLLIVDDAEENLAFIEAVIRSVRVNLIKALSGAEALEKTKGLELALAIIDVRMPGMNGYELAMKMNEERAPEKVPVIFLTANTPDEMEVIKGYDNGAVDYILKPVYRHVLLCKINVFLDLYDQKQTIIRHAGLLKKYADELTLANSALRQSEEKYRSYIDHALDGVFVADETGRYVEVNEAACRITGYPREELLNMSVPDLLPPESLEEGLAEFRKIIETGTSKADQLFRHQDGSVRWWTVESVKLSEARLLCFTKDITDRKKAEEELRSSLEQLHQLTQYIEKVRENERVAISRELHDELGQALTAVKIDLGMIRLSVTDPEVVAKISKVSALVSEIIKTVQRLTAQLRPQILDDLGLEAAIEWYTKEFAERNGVEIVLGIDSELAIPPDATLTIFRIMQESLTNVARHAKATRVDIGLNKTGENILLRIADNGAGINENEIKSKKSFGIINMKERAASLGGAFNISGEKGGGTVIKLIIPLDKNSIV